MKSRTILIAIVLFFSVLRSDAAMAHGTQDYGSTAPAQTIASVQDVGEVAARLGSPDTFDRRGNVVFQSDMSKGLGAFNLPTVALDDYFELSTAYARSSSFSMHIHGTTDAAAYDDAELGLGVLNPGRIGFEQGVFLSGNFVSFSTRIRVFDGANSTRFQVKFDQATGIFSYLGSDNAYHAFSQPISLLQWGYYFSDMKLVIDTATLQYVRFLWNNNQYDLSGKSGHAGLSSVGAEISTETELQTGIASPGDMYIDHWIVTQNEP